MLCSRSTINKNINNKCFDRVSHLPAKRRSRKGEYLLIHCDYGTVKLSRLTVSRYILGIFKIKIYVSIFKRKLYWLLEQKFLLNILNHHLQKS